MKHSDHRTHVEFEMELYSCSADYAGTNCLLTDVADGLTFSISVLKSDSAGQISAGYLKLLDIVFRFVSPMTNGLFFLL